jgi:DNA repair protein RecN (Recombination protein N)
MLERLSVRNLVVIREADLELASGLNVVTGETGAGKTMLTQALGLVLGERGDASLVGPNGHEAYVEAVFGVGEELLAEDAFDGVRELVDDLDDGLIAARRVSRDGRARALVCGRAATRAALEAAGAELVSVVSQHEARALSRPAVQRALLDAFAGEEQAARLRAMAAAFDDLAAARRDRAAADDDAAAADRLTVELQDLAARVEGVAPAAGEDGALREERERLRNADALLAAAGGAAALLSPDDGDGAVVLAERAERALRDAEAHDARLAALAADVRDGAIRLAEAAHALHAYAASVEHDPHRLDAVEERLERLDDLRRRHGSLEGALAAAAAARERLDRLGRRDEELARLVAAEEAAHAAAEAAAAALTAARRSAAGDLGHAVERHLADLGMAEARFRVELGPRELGRAGADDVRFVAAVNPGVDPGAIAQTASGGELSRIALAIRVAAQERRGAPILVFDEVDAGVGGRTALAVADKLAELARTTQVLCVTHLAQIAARADRHFRVVKEPGDPTVTRIERLDGDEVDTELARMLGGDAESDEARRLAQALRGARA